MHRALAAWLTERHWRAVLASAISGMLWQMMLPFSVVLAGAIPVLAALRFGDRFGLGAAALGAAVAWSVAAPVQPAFWITLAVLLLFFAPVSLAILLRRTGSLNLCFQVAVIGAVVALCIVHALLPEPTRMWEGVLRDLLETMQDAGLTLEGDLEGRLQIWARTMWGALTALVLATLMGSLWLGRWWQSLLQSPGAFGAEYRGLRLGRVLGIAITIVLIAALLVESPLLASMAWVSFASLSFQGLAAAHRSKAGGRLNRGWLAAIYVLLIVPLSMSVTVFALAIWGFADNWLRPRVAAQR